MNIVDVLQCGYGSGLARLARASASLEAHDRDVDLDEAMRFALEHLFKRDTPVRAKSLALAAVMLRSLPAKKRTVGVEMLVDFFFAACLARTQRRDAAVAVVEGWREMLRPIVYDHREKARTLECSGLLEDRARAALLQEEAYELEMSFDVFATDILSDASVTSVTSAPKRVERPSAPTPVKQPTLDAKRLVLVVDDDDDVRLSLGLLLEENGYTVVSAENGARAVAMIEDGLQPTVILLDLMMPVMSGWDFHKWQQGRTTVAHPTIVFTATGLKPGSLGTLPILSKTVDASEILSAVSKVALAPIAA